MHSRQLHPNFHAFFNGLLELLNQVINGANGESAAADFGYTITLLNQRGLLPRAIALAWLRSVWRDARVETDRPFEEGTGKGRP